MPGAPDTSKARNRRRMEALDDHLAQLQAAAEAAITANVRVYEELTFARNEIREVLGLDPAEAPPSIIQAAIERLEKEVVS